jgi:glycosyltransferase involved in cell wall biosynthesis
LRICIIGKFPPIQGGVSMRTYWTAHALAARGHDVHVITNAKEVGGPFRMHMRAEDWARCEANSETGSVSVHWTDPVDRSQSHIPQASPFITKLCTLAASAHSERPFDVIYSHYMEPYGVAGHLAAEMTQRPHVVRMAGSDAGRLWQHPQFEALYDHVLRSARFVVAAGAVADRAIERGVPPDRLVAGGGYNVPEGLFTPEGPILDFAALRAECEGNAELQPAFWGGFSGERPYFGVYGKLGESKGSFALLAAMDQLKMAGVEVGLVALAHGHTAVERSFRERAEALGLNDRIRQLPFLPHWRVPEFLRGCLAVCCLEQDFPIGFHTPITPREVLLCGTCLVASAEVIRKLPGWDRLPDGYGCAAIKDVNDIDELSRRLAAIARSPSLAAAVGRRGREFARDLQRHVPFPDVLERVIAIASNEPRLVRRRVPKAKPQTSSDTNFPLTRLVEAAIRRRTRRTRDSGPRRPRKIDIAFQEAEALLAKLERCIEKGEVHLTPLACAVRLELAIAAAKAEARDRDHDPLFRLDIREWAIADDLSELITLREPNLHLLQFDYDVSGFRSVRHIKDFPSVTVPQPSFIVVFAGSGQAGREPLMIDSVTARILRFSDGTRTVSEILRLLGTGTAFATRSAGLAWIEGLFVSGLIAFQCGNRLPSGGGLDDGTAHASLAQ